MSESTLRRKLAAASGLLVILLLALFLVVWFFFVPRRAEARSFAWPHPRIVPHDHVAGDTPTSLATPRGLESAGLCVAAS